MVASSRVVASVAAATSTAVVVAVEASARGEVVAVPVVPSAAVVLRPHKFPRHRDEGMKNTRRNE